MTLAVRSAVLPSDLGGLAERISEEHRLVVLHANETLEHAIACGAALLAAREVIGRGDWEGWVVANCPEVGRMAKEYCRLSYYAAILPEGISQTEALRHLRGLPSIDGHPWRHPPELRDEAIRLNREEGLTQREIAEVLSVARSVIGRWLRGVPNTTRAGRGRRTRAEERQRAERIRRLQIERHGRQLGSGSVGKGYGLLRRTIEAVDRAMTEDGISVEARAHVDAALGALYRAEDEIGLAIRKAVTG